MTFREILIVTAAAICSTLACEGANDAFRDNDGAPTPGGMTTDGQSPAQDMSPPTSDGGDGNMPADVASSDVPINGNDDAASAIDTGNVADSGHPPLDAASTPTDAHQVTPDAHVVPPPADAALPQPDAGPVCDPRNEVCDGADNDCDGLVDEGCPPVCVPIGIELCNGLDDDCNGQVDDLPGTGLVCRVGVGACQRIGVTVCDIALGTTCSVGPGRPAEDEVCDGANGRGDGNGLDDDCNGRVDESCPCNAGNYQPIGTTCGFGECDGSGMTECQTGFVADPCQAGEPEVPNDAICDGRDNDCDGVTDEDCPP